MQRVLGPVLEKKADLRLYGERSFADTLKAVARLPVSQRYSFRPARCRNSTGAVYGDKEPLKRISSLPNAPIFTFDESYFNGEVVGGPMFHRLRVPSRLLLSPSRILEARRQETSRFRRQSSRRRNTIGGSFSDGTSARVRLLREVRCCSGAVGLGTVCAGRLSRYLESCFFKAAQSQAYCMRIAAVELQKLKQSSACQSWRGSIAI